MRLCFGLQSCVHTLVEICIFWRFSYSSAPDDAARAMLRYIQIAENDPEPMADLSIWGYGRASPLQNFPPLFVALAVVRRGNFGVFWPVQSFPPIPKYSLVRGISRTGGKSSAISPDGGFSHLSCLHGILVLSLDWNGVFSHVFSQKRRKNKEKTMKQWSLPPNQWRSITTGGRWSMKPIFVN